MSKKVLFVAAHLGSARMMLPLIKETQNLKEFDVLILAQDQAKAFFESKEVLVADLPGFKKPDTGKMSAFLRHHNIDRVVAGTGPHCLLSWGFIKAAAQQGVQSAALVEDVDVYSKRFKIKGKLARPDVIFTVDDRVKNDMVDCGYEASRITVAGFTQVKSFVAENKEELVFNPHYGYRALPSGSRTLLFMSEPLEQNPLQNPYDGYNEKRILDHVIYAVESLSAERNERWTVLVHVHPEQDKADFNYLSWWSGRTVIQVVDDQNIHGLMKVADVVVGMQSSRLVEAALKARPVLSVQPRLKGPDTLYTNALEATLPVYRIIDLPDALEGILYSSRIRARLFEGTRGLELPGMDEPVILNWLRTDVPVRKAA